MAVCDAEGLSSAFCRAVPLHSRLGQHGGWHPAVAVPWRAGVHKGNLAHPAPICFSSPLLRQMGTSGSKRDRGVRSLLDMWLLIIQESDPGLEVACSRFCRIKIVCGVGEQVCVMGGRVELVRAVPLGCGLLSWNFCDCFGQSQLL